ncbi:unnamed protein product [Linum trigynum]|uniref:Uncharacterized protein n=1 Tax=Linum trigynum TaxID=586398 RepID=A0AAV2E4H9_9ROSI
MSEITNDEDILGMSTVANGGERVIELYAISNNDIEDFMKAGLEEVRKGVEVECEVDRDYDEDEDNDYVCSEEDLSDGDNDQFEEYVNQDVEADMGGFKIGNGQPEVVEEEVEYVDSDDRKSIVSSDSDDGYQVEEFRVDQDMEAPTFVASQKFSIFVVLKEAIKQHAL